MDYSVYLASAVYAAKEAGIYLQKAFYDKEALNVKVKGYKQIVTKQDVTSQQIILNNMQYDDHLFICEEKENDQKAKEFTWYIDPLDGTTNYVARYPNFAVSIALQHNGETVVGAVYLPMLDELFSAEKGKGAFLNSESIHVSDKEELQGALLCIAEGDDTPSYTKTIELFTKLRTTNKFRRYGSIAMDLCKIAQGSIDAVIVHGVKTWDVMAGNFIIEEAGGKVMDFQGKDWNQKTKEFLAGNTKVTEKLRKIL